MLMDRRSFVKAGMVGAVALAGGRGLVGSALAQEGQNTMSTQGGELIIHPVSHASLVLEAQGTVIYVDPVGGASAYESFARPNLILVTHEHEDHFDAQTLQGLASETTKLVTNPAVFGMLPEQLRGGASQLANGERSEVAGFAIEAIPAYNITEDRLKYHPKGRDNGYILGLQGARVYIAGDTEDIPEMRGLEGIDLAFVPMNLPYTMTVEQAASAVTEFAPKVVYPYHFRDSDVQQFKSLVEQGGKEIEVRLAKWY